MPLRSSRCLHPRRASAPSGSMPSIDAAGEARAGVGVLDAHARGAALAGDRARGSPAGATSGAPVMAATSRAMPSIDRQSARLGVSFSVISVSSSASAARRSAPTTRVVGQREQSGRVVVDAEFLRRAQHALRFDAAHRRARGSRGRRAAARRRARRAPSCRRRRWARRRRSAAARPRRRRRCTRAGGRRSGCGATASIRADDDAGERRRGGRGVLDFEARHRQLVAQARRVERRIRPACAASVRRISSMAGPYANWRRKRRSFS